MDINTFIDKVVKCENFCNCTGPCEAIAKWQYDHPEEGQKYADRKKNNRHVPEPFNGDPETAKIVFISSNPSVRLNENTPRIGDNCYDFFVHRFDESDKSKKYVRHEKPFNYYALDKDGNNCGDPVKYWKNAAKIARILKDVGLNQCLLTEVVKCKTHSEDKEVITGEVVTECMKKHFRNFLDMLSSVNKDIIFVVVGDLTRKYINKWVTEVRKELKAQKITNKKIKRVLERDESVEWEWDKLKIKLFYIRHLSGQGFKIYAAFDKNEKFVRYTPIVIPPNISEGTLENLRSKQP